MIKDKARGRILAVAIIIILIIQVANLIRWKGQKGGFFIDELYTIEYTCEYNDTEKYHDYIYTAPDFEEDRWMDVSDYQDKFEFTADKSIFKLPVSQALSYQMDRKPYFTLLNMICSLFGDKADVAACSIWFNIVLFVITVVLLFFIVRKITDSDIAGLSAMMFYGFAGVTIGLTVYVRFYIFVGLLTLAVYYLQYLIWIEDKLWRQILLEMVMGVILLITMISQELVAVFFAAFCLALTVGMLIKKQHIKAAVYFVPIAGAGMFYLYKSDILNRLANVDVNETGHVSNIVKHILEFDAERFKSNSDYWMDIIWHHVFGARICMLIIGLLCVLFLITLLIDRQAQEPKDIFVILIVISCLIYGMFHFVTGYSWRYMIYSFIGWVIVLSYIFGRICLFFEGKNKWIYRIVTGLIFLTLLYGALKTYTTSDINYVYAGDKAVLDIVRADYSDYDSVILHETAENGYGHLYDAVYNVGHDTRIKYLTEATFDKLPAEKSDHFLIWTHEYSDILDDERLLPEGYDVEMIGRTHISDIYVCSKSGQE